MFSVTWKINVPMPNGTERSGEVKYWSGSFCFILNRFLLFRMGKGRAKSLCSVLVLCGRAVASRGGKSALFNEGTILSVGT